MSTGIGTGAGRRWSALGAEQAGGMTPATTEHWKDEPEEHDYPAAFDYLSLIMTKKEADDVVERLRKAEVVRRKGKDVLRASGLPFLPRDNKHVAADLAKVADGQRLSPVLLVRGRLADRMPLVVADGYHRVCASYWIDEDAEIPCKLA